MFGTCKFGADCRHDHPPDEAGGEPERVNPISNLERLARSGEVLLLNGFAQAGGLPVRPGEKECSFFMKTGMCRYGETCRWHNPRELQATEVKFLQPSDSGIGLGAGGGMGVGMQGMQWGIMGVQGMQTGMVGMQGVGASEWETHMSDEGWPYDFNKIIGECRWDRPPALMMGGSVRGGIMSMGGGVVGGGVGGGFGVVGAGRPQMALVASLNAGAHPLRPCADNFETACFM